MSKNLILFTALAISAFACSHSKIASMDPNSLDPIPQAAPQTSDPNQETIAVVAINDFHGSLLAKERKLPNGKVVQSGGAEALAGMIKLLREEMHGNVAIVDAGDEWQGTMESNLSKGATVVDFYNRLGVNVAAIGNHEFDFGVPNMNEQFSKAKYGYVASNIFKKRTGMRPNWDNVTPSQLIEVGGLKIGVIGVSTQQTPQTTRYEYVSDLSFKNSAKYVSTEAKRLRKKGASLVLVTSHAGTVCEEKDGLADWKILDETSPVSKCDDEQEIMQLSRDLKPGVIDGIVSGHTHHIMHHFIRHIPIVQDEAFNQFFNVIYYTFDKNTHQLIPSLTRIEGLVPICYEVFENTHHCDVRRLPKEFSPKLVPASFHGHPIPHDLEIEAWLKPIRESTEKYRKEIVGFSELPLSHYRDQESPFGNFMAEVLREKAHSDFALVNSGGIRTSLDAGAITYDGLFRALPFDNLLNIVPMSGAQIKLLFRLATSGTHGIPGTSGVRLTLIPADQKAPGTDLDRDGKVERWETNRLLKIETDKGNPIEDKKMYTVATYDFLVTGGDDMKFVMDQIPKNKISRVGSGYCRDLATEYLAKHRTINTKDHPLVDPKNPRIIFQNSPGQNP